MDSFNLRSSETHATHDGSQSIFIKSKTDNTNREAWAGGRGYSVCLAAIYQRGCVLRSSSNEEPPLRSPRALAAAEGGLPPSAALRRAIAVSLVLLPSLRLLPSSRLLPSLRLPLTPFMLLFLIGAPGHRLPRHLLPIRRESCTAQQSQIATAQSNGPTATAAGLGDLTAITNQSYGTAPALPVTRVTTV
jgi:hypothetical protein